MAKLKIPSLSINLDLVHVNVILVFTNNAKSK